MQSTTDMNGRLKFSISADGAMKKFLLIVSFLHLISLGRIYEHHGRVINRMILLINGLVASFSLEYRAYFQSLRHQQASLV